MAAMTAASLAELAHRFGVATEYHDWTGRSVPVEEDTLIAVLAALGVEAHTEEGRAAALSAQDTRHWSRPLPPTIIGRADSETSFWVHVTHGDPAHVWVRLEDGTVRTGVRQADNFTPPYDLDGRLVGEATFVLPADLPLGYHRVHLRSGATESSTPLIVTPSWLGLPARLGTRRTWGLATQLYSVRSKNSWGVGDLGDLTDLAVWAGARHGAGYILVNPLHAAAPTKPMEPSPTCRHRGGSPIRCTCVSRRSPSSRICPNADGCGNCAPRCRRAHARSTRSTGTQHGPRNALR